LVSASITNQGNDINGNGFLTLSGNGLFQAAGFDNTDGEFLLTDNQAGTTFSLFRFGDRQSKAARS
jgi:hypothetical protein